jgi:hypothetical protein
VVSAALQPDPERRPGLAEVIRRLGGDATATLTPTPPSADEEDPFTLPLAIAAHDESMAPTRVTQGAPLPPDRPFDQERGDWLRHTRAFTTEGDQDPDDLPVDLEPVPRRESAALVFRRGVTMLAAGLAVATAVSAWPYWSLALVLVGSWLLRTCTLTVTAHGDRRRLRGARWYDVLVAPLSAPWYLVAAVPGALLLGAWALGVGVAGLLLSYAAGFSAAATLLVGGLCVEAGLWAGPGGAHVRWPVRVVAHAVARRTGRWAVITIVVVAFAGFVGHQAALDIDWSPFGRPPLVGH